MIRRCALSSIPAAHAPHIEERHEKRAMWDLCNRAVQEFNKRTLECAEITWDLECPDKDASAITQCLRSAIHRHECTTSIAACQRQGRVWIYNRDQEHRLPR